MEPPIAAWLAEAFLLGTLTEHTVILYCTFILLAFMTEHLRQVQAGQDVQAEPELGSEWEDVRSPAA